MASIEKDTVSGQMTTGHEWDGIKELNTPLPKWWVYVFWATVIWAIGYWIAMPAWPTVNDYSRGLLGYSSRGELNQELNAQNELRAKFTNQIAALPITDVVKNRDLRDFAIAGGKTVFGRYCSVCHGSGGIGVPGAYPALVDDEWIWGGSLDQILQTVTHGVRNADPDSHQGEMLKFGVDGILNKTQIDQVADYVLSLAKKSPAAGSPGAQIFADNCAVCHGEDGAGNPDLGAPALNNNIWLYGGDKAAIVAQVTSPQHGIMPSWAGVLKPEQIKMVAVYVHALGGGK